MDEPAWIELYRAHVAALYGVVSRRVGGDRALAEDVTQEAWLRALDAWRRDGVPRDPAAWLRTVAANLLRNHFGRRRLESHAGPELASDAAEPEAEAESDESSSARAAILQRGLARLRPLEAELLAARHLEGLSLADLAHRHGLSLRAVEGRLRRARGALARHLGASRLTLLDGH